jgi:hypothetical protein
MMKISLMFTIGVVLVFICCKASAPKEYKLSDEKLALLLLDLQFAEITLPDLSPGEQDSIKALFDQRLEEIYHLSKEEMKKEMEKLQSDPEKLKWVVDRAKQMADSIR